MEAMIYFVSLNSVICLMFVTGDSGFTNGPTADSSSAVLHSSEGNRKNDITSNNEHVIGVSDLTAKMSTKISSTTVSRTVTKSQLRISLKTLHSFDTIYKHPVTSEITSVPSVIKPVSSVITSVSSVITPVPSVITPLFSGITPGSPVITPVSSVITPVSSNSTPIPSAIAPVPSVITPLPPFIIPVPPVITSVSSVITLVPSVITPVPSVITPVSSVIIPTTSTLQTKTPRKTEPPSVVLQGLIVRAPTSTVSTVKTDIPKESRAIESDINHMNDGAHVVKDEITKEAREQDEPNRYRYLKIYENKTYANPMFQHLVPIILGLCLLTTLAFIFVLGKRLQNSSSSMSRTSCLLLISVALADILTMCFAASETIYLYRNTIKNNGFLLFDNCRTMLILERLSAIPHATSTWFTVTLASQRYLCVSKPFSAGKYISIKSSCIVLLFIGFLTISLRMCRFFDKTFAVVSIQVIATPGNVTIETCVGKYAKWIADPILYESCFAWIRIILAQFIPCVLLVFLVYQMVRKLKHSTQNSLRMQIVYSKLSSDRRQLSIFVSIVALIVFSIEMASGVFLSFNAWNISTGDIVISYNTLKDVSISFDLILYLSYFAVFLIYCLMSKEIRRTATSVCCLAKCRKRNCTDNSGNNPDDKKELESIELSPSSKKFTP